MSTVKWVIPVVLVLFEGKNDEPGERGLHTRLWKFGAQSESIWITSKGTASPNVSFWNDSKEGSESSSEIEDLKSLTARYIIRILGHVFMSLGRRFAR